jgi:hypothetical protein
MLKGEQAAVEMAWARSDAASCQESLSAAQMMLREGVGAMTDQSRRLHQCREEVEKKARCAASADSFLNDSERARKAARCEAIEWGLEKFF